MYQEIKKEIESDLIQALGRARTLRTGTKVDLYSNFSTKNKFRV